MSGSWLVRLLDCGTERQLGGRRERVNECHQACENADEASQRKPPARCHVAAFGEYRRPKCKHSVAQRIHAPEQDYR